VSSSEPQATMQIVTDKMRRPIHSILNRRCCCTGEPPFWVVFTMQFDAIMRRHSRLVYLSPFTGYDVAYIHPTAAVSSVDTILDAWLPLA
jgi:hypothetical protein